MKHKLALTCVIITKNRPESLERLLASLHKQSLKNFEIIVVNDGGSPLKLIAQEGIEIRVVEKSQSVGSGKARNDGVRQASGDVILLLDDDIELISENFLELGLKAMESSGEIGLVFAKKIDIGPKKIEELSLFKESLYTGELVKASFEEKQKQKKGIVFGAMVTFVRRQAFSDISGYDSVFGWGIGHSFREESDFQIRVQEKGWKVQLVPEISFYHHIQPSGGHGSNQFKKIFWIAHNQAVFGARHLRYWPLKQVMFMGMELPRYAWGNGKMLSYPAGLLGAGAGLVSYAFKRIKGSK